MKLKIGEEGKESFANRHVVYHVLALSIAFGAHGIGEEAKVKVDGGQLLTVIQK